MNPKNITGDNESLTTYIYYFRDHDIMEVLLSYAVLKERNYHFYELLNKKLLKFSLSNNFDNIDEFLNSYIENNGFKSILDFIQNSEFKDPNIKKNKIKNMWENTRGGVILFCVFHFLYEFVMNMLYHGPALAIWVPVIANYFISAWFIKYKFSTNKFVYSSFSKHLFLYGIFISFIVFLIRITIGFAFSLILVNR